MDCVCTCPECGGRMYSPHIYGCDYIQCYTCGLIRCDDGTFDRSDMDEE